MKLNVIIRDTNYVIKDVFKIKFDINKFANVQELSEYLKQKYNIMGMFYHCEYEFECKKNYLYCLASQRKKLTLDVDFNDVEFSKYYKITHNSPLTINCILEGGGAGGPGMLQVLQMFFFIRDVIVLFSTIFYVIILLVLPFRKIKKKYGYGKNFVGDIINSQEECAFGFFDMKRIKFNKLLEFSVMHKLGYKLKNKIWIKNQIFDFTENYNKYDYF